jgi:diguanylate cyclase (GGDEF)-like protein
MILMATFVGDQVLIDLAQKISGVIRKKDLFGRIGGDEFLLYIHQVPSRNELEQIAKRVCEIVSEKIELDFQASVSIGISLFPQDGKEFEELYQKADVALYQVKNNGKNSFAFYQDIDKEKK